MSAAELLPIVVVVVIIGTVFWVYADARSHAEVGEPVVFSAGSIRLDSPELWAIVCLVLWVICFPIYLATRKHQG